jgi:hypothetical protein
LRICKFIRSRKVKGKTPGSGEAGKPGSKKAQGSKVKARRLGCREARKLKGQSSVLKVKSTSLAPIYRTTIFFNWSFCINVFS